MDYSPPDSSVHGIFQARILEWVAISFSRRSPPPRDQAWISCIAGRFFTNWATRDARFHNTWVYISVSPLCVNLDKAFNSLRLVLLPVRWGNSYDWDFPGSPVVKYLLCNAGNEGSIPGQGTKIPHAVEQLSPLPTTTEFMCHNI